MRQQETSPRLTMEISDDNDQEPIKKVSEFKSPSFIPSSKNQESSN